MFFDLPGYRRSVLRCKFIHLAVPPTSMQNLSFVKQLLDSERIRGIKPGNPASRQKARKRRSGGKDERHGGEA